MYHINYLIEIYPNNIFFDRMNALALPHLQITAVTSVSINSDLSKLTDTATVTIPAKNMKLNKNKLIGLNSKGQELEINVGDQITIELFYDDLNNGKKNFVGYITSFSVNNQTNEIIISCEDSMYLFKHKKIKKSFGVISGPNLDNLKIDISYYLKTGIRYSNITKISDVVNFILDENKLATEGIKVIATDFEISTFLINDYVTGAEVFDKLKELYKINIYFRNEYTKVGNSFKTTPVLVVGFKYPIEIPEVNNLSDFFMKYQYSYPSLDKRKDPFFKVGLYNAIINNNLTFNYFNKINDLIVTVNSSQNFTNALFAGTIDGVTVFNDPNLLNYQLQSRNLKVDFTIPNLNIETINKMALDKWSKYPTTGFSGTIDVFGMPLLRHSDIINLIIDTGKGVSNKVDQDYYIDAVITNFNTQTGLTQTVTIGSKIKDNSLI